MREPVDAERIERFLAELAKAATQPTTVYLVGGASAVLVGWHLSARDIDLVIQPESDALLRTIARLKDTLAINVELAAPVSGGSPPTARSSRGGIQSGSGGITIDAAMSQ
jgi:hypothetical protein